MPLAYVFFEIFDYSLQRFDLPGSTDIPDIQYLRRVSSSRIQMDFSRLSILVRDTTSSCCGSLELIL